MKTIYIFIGAFFCFSSFASPCRILFEEGAGFQGVRDSVQLQKIRRNKKKFPLSLSSPSSKEKKVTASSVSGSFGLQNDKKVLGQPNSSPTTLSNTLFMDFGNDDF